MAVTCRTSGEVHTGHQLVRAAAAHAGKVHKALILTGAGFFARGEEADVIAFDADIVGSARAQTSDTGISHVFAVGHLVARAQAVAARQRQGISRGVHCRRVDADVTVQRVVARVVEAGLTCVDAHEILASVVQPADGLVAFALAFAVNHHVAVGQPAAAANVDGVIAGVDRA